MIYPTNTRTTLLFHQRLKRIYPNWETPHLKSAAKVILLYADRSADLRLVSQYIPIFVDLQTCNNQVGSPNNRMNHFQLENENAIWSAVLLLGICTSLFSIRSDANEKLIRTWLFLLLCYFKLCAIPSSVLIL